MRPTVGIGIVLLGASGLSACGSGQADSDYRGEPLMSLHGVVTSSESALSADLVPGIAFTSRYELLESRSLTVHFVASEVEGSFPSSFTMRIYDEPDPAVPETVIEGEPAYAIGTINAISVDHPKSLRTEYGSITEGDTMYDFNTMCDDQGRCISGKTGACPLDTFDPNREWPCGYEYPDNLPWAIYGYVKQGGMLYLTEAVPAGSVLSRLYARGEALSAGYHFLAPNPDFDMNDTECSLMALSDANTVVNETYGTSYGPTSSPQQNLAELGLEQGIAQLRTFNSALQTGYAELGCQIAFQVPADPAAQVELAFSDQPQMLFW